MSGTLPPGYTLDAPPKGALPPGYTLDQTSQPPPSDPATLPMSGDYEQGSGFTRNAQISIPTIKDVREALAPPPGYVASGVLPIATKEVSPGQGDPSAGIKWDWGPVRSLVNPLLDLLEGTGWSDQGDQSPYAGKVSPEATLAMLGIATGNPLSQARNPLAHLGSGDLRFGSEPVPPGLAVREAPLPPDFRQNPLAPAAITKIQETPPGAPISGEPAVPPETPTGAQAAGAQATTEPIPPTTKAEDLTNLQKSVLQSAVDRAGPQMRDDTVYVPGVQRPLATRDFTPQNALDDKLFRESDPVYRANAEKIDRNNNDVMKDAIYAHAGDQNSLAAAYDARRAVSPDQMGVFTNEQPVSVEPLLSAIDDALASPAGRRGAVQRTLNNVRASLTRTGDDPTAMPPSQVYGARQNITDLLQKGATGAGDEAKDIQAAKAMLTDLLPSFDSQIAIGAPRYPEYMSEFQRLSQPINQQEFLQKYLTGTGKLTNDQGMLLPNRVQKLLDDIYQGQSARGANRANSLTPDALNTIEGVRNELAYNVLRDRNAATKGSDTFQKTNQAGVLGTGPLGMAVRGGAEAAAHLVLAPLTAGVGNVLLSGFTRGLEARRLAAETARLNARKAQLLDLGGQPSAP